MPLYMHDEKKRGSNCLVEVCSQEAAGLSDGTETFWPEEEHSFDISCKGHEQLKSFSFSYKDSNLH